jgi:hypothetical protein
MSQPMGGSGPGSLRVLRECLNYGLRNRLRFQPLLTSEIDSDPHPGLRAFHGEIRVLQNPMLNIETASAEARDRRLDRQFIPESERGQKPGSRIQPSG